MTHLSHLNCCPVLAVTPGPFYHSSTLDLSPKHQHYKSRYVLGEHADIHGRLAGLNKQFFSIQRDLVVILTVGLLHPNPAPTTTTSLFEAPLRPLAGHPLQAPRMVLVSPIRKEAAPLHMAGFIAPTTAPIQPPSGNRATPRPAYRKTSTL